MVIILIILIILLILGVLVWGTYNKLVKLNEIVKEAWSDITVQLKYRADLIPNLVETVKGYAKHEKEAFENVTAARSAVIGAKSVKTASEAESNLNAALSKVFAIGALILTIENLIVVLLQPNEYWINTIIRRVLLIKYHTPEIVA